MLINEFVSGRNVEKQAIYRYLSRHKDLMQKCTKKGKELDMPDEVIKELDKKYPLPQPVQILNGVPEEEHRRALEMIIRLQDELLNVKTELLDFKAENMEMKLLENSKNAEISNLHENNAYLQQEIDKMRNRTLWERIRNK